jgi:two-component system, OmpR family, sensor kinase
MTSKFGTHEVRTRLAIARGFVELIAAATPDAEIRSDAELVLGELDKASSMVSSLLTLATVIEPSARAPLNVKNLIDAVLRRWVGTADREWSSSTFAGEVSGDAERLESALDCLIENAVKFTEPGDSIDITSKIDRAVLEISVSDNGAGIPADELDRVFDMFQTSTTAGDRAGSGLGLPIVKAMVEARRGSVSARSTVGAGSCFTLRVPLVDPVPRSAGVEIGPTQGFSLHC